MYIPLLANAFEAPLYLLWVAVHRLSIPDEDHQSFAVNYTTLSKATRIGLWESEVTVPTCAWS